MTSFSEKVLHGLAWGQIGMLTRSVICFVISMIVARALGAENYGVYAALSSYVMLLVRFTEMGSEAVINTYVPKYYGCQRPGKAAYILWKLLFYRLALALMVGLLLYGYYYYGFSFPGMQWQYVPLVIGWYVIRSMMDCMVYIIWARMAMKYYALVEFFISVAQLSAVLILNERGFSVAQLLLLMIAINAGQLLAYSLGSRSVLAVKAERFPVRPIFQFGATIWLSTVLHYFISKGIDIVMIVHYAQDTRQAAFYDIAYLLVMTGALALLTAIDSLKLPVLSEAYGRYGMDGLRQSWQLLTKLSLYLTAPPLLFLTVHADAVIALFYGSRYADASVLIQGLSVLTLLGLCLANEVSPIILFPLNKERLYLLLHGSQGILNLILNMVLIPEYGALGAVLATGSARVLVSCVQMLVAVKILNTRLPLGFILITLGAISVSLYITHFLPAQTLLELSCNGLLFGLLTTLIISRVHNFSDQERGVLQQLKPGLYAKLTKYQLI